MIKVLFVEDEILAMEYLQNLIPWSEHGFDVVGHALNGRKALEIFDRELPEIVISDIKMVGMDGLELTRELRRRNDEVVVILLSAYKDFEYAQKGIDYGVFNYLLKHELCEEKLLRELERVRQRLAAGNRKTKIYHRYFARHLIYNTENISEDEERELGNRFFLLLLHKNDRFSQGNFYEQEWTPAEVRKLSEWQEDAEGISYMADIRLTANNIIMLYRIGDLSSRYQVVSRIEQIAEKLVRLLSSSAVVGFNLLYSNEIKRNEISQTFQKMSGQIRYAIFWTSCCAYAVNRLTAVGEEALISWDGIADRMRGRIYDEKQPPDDLVEGWFEQVRDPEVNLRAFRELLYILEYLAQELERQEDLGRQEDWGREPSPNGSKYDDIRKYYLRWFQKIYQAVQDRDSQNYSHLVRMMLNHIRQNFDQELSLEALGEEFNMNGVYLGQIFRKETGITFLKYLTNCRIEEAKQLLAEGRLNIYEISSRIGYKTSQYFSQIFARETGMKPQEYKKWNGKRTV